MKTITLALFFASTFLVTPMVAQDYELKFDIVNNTGVDLFGVYVTDTDTDEWGDDLIPYDVFENGTVVNITIPIDDQTLCEYDIKIEEDSENSIQFDELDFCELQVLTLSMGKNGVIYYTVE